MISVSLKAAAHFLSDRPLKDILEQKLFIRHAKNMGKPGELSPNSCGLAAVRVMGFLLYISSSRED